MMPAPKAPPHSPLRSAPLPPHDLETEQIVLSTVLEVPGSIEQIRGLLVASDWYSDQHALIWAAACEVEDPNVATVKKRLDQKGLLLQAGGAKYLVEINQTAPVTSQLARKARRLRELAEVRRLIAFCHSAAAEGYGLEEPSSLMARLLAETTREGVVVRGFQSISIDQLFEPVAPIEWAIDGIVPVGSVVELESYGGSGKSWLGVDAAIAVASGTPWLGRFATQQGTVAYLDYENGNREMRRRMQACTRARGLDSVDGIALVTMPSVYLSSEAAEHSVTALARGRQLVVVDTFRAGCPDLDENDSRIRMPLDMLRRVAERTGCAFMVLIHSKKQTAQQTDIREAGRGSSAIFDAADVVVHCAYDDGELTLTCAKSRLGRAFDPCVATIADTPDGAVMVTAKDAPSEDEVNEAEIEELTERVLAIIRDAPGCTTRLIRQRARGRAVIVDVAIEVLERNGAIKNLGKGKARCAAQWYPLGADGGQYGGQ